MKLSNATYKQKLAAVLWVQGFKAEYIAFLFGVQPKAIYKRIANIKKNNFFAWERMTSMRKCFFKQKHACIHPRKYNTSFLDNNKVVWWNSQTGQKEELEIIRKF